MTKCAVKFAASVLAGTLACGGCRHRAMTVPATGKVRTAPENRQTPAGPHFPYARPYFPSRVYVVDLRWADSAQAIAYNVYRGDAAGGPYSLIGNTASPRYTDGATARGATYYYVVTAVDQNGAEGAFSSEVVAEVPR